MKLYESKDTVFETIKGYKFEIARSDNHAFRNKFKHLSKKYKRALDNGSLSTEKEDAIVSKAAAGTVLVGWEMVSSVKGQKEVPYSTAEAEKTLIEDEVLRDEIMSIARAHESFLFEEEEETKKK